MSNNYSVYLHICPDGQKYVGITSQPVKQRWNNGKGYPGTWFERCGIDIFGWDNIRHKVLYTGLSKSDAEKLELELIIKYESWCPNRGFNDAFGGSYNSIKPVKVMDLGFIFPTVKRCAEYLNIPQYGIRNCKNKPDYYGHVFEYACATNVSSDDICIV